MFTARSLGVRKKFVAREEGGQIKNCIMGYEQMANKCEQQ